jgi:GNAT superfamily N-acetyltransferase
LIKNTYSEFNLDFLSPEEQVPFLGPFAHAENPSLGQLAELEKVIWSEIVLIAEERNQIVGVLRGRLGRLGSLFVAKDQQRKGIASQLGDEFERQIKQQGCEIIKVVSTLYAIPFYLEKATNVPLESARAGALMVLV